jgi:hypothetical protein
MEVLVVVIFAAIGVGLFFVEKASVDAMARDERRKVAVNAMYYALEEGFYVENGYYPEEISEDNLKVIDPALFTDPDGLNLGVEGSSYRYEAVNCEDGKCRSYTLRAVLEREEAFVKSSRN